MSHFGTQPTDESLYISVSPDGENWTCLNNNQPVYRPVNWASPTNVVRDPSIVYKNGWYWVAYTSGHIGGQPSFGLVKSQDLINWTFVKDVSTWIPDLPNAQDYLTWGPFFFKDNDGSVHLFVSIGMRDFTRMRTFELHPTNGDFTEWSAPQVVDLPLYNGKVFSNEFWVWREGDVYHAIYVDFMDNAAYVHVQSDQLLTGWKNRVRMGFDSMEGAFILKNHGRGYTLMIENINGYWRATLTDGFGPAWYYDQATSQWTFPMHLTSMSRGMRNGKAILAEGTTTYADWSANLAEQANPLQDADEDGILNLNEFTLGLNPKKPGVVKMEKWFDDLHRLRCRYVTLPAAKGSLRLAWTTEFTARSWNAAEPVMKLASATMMEDGREMREWIQDTNAVPAGSPFFLRLEMSLPSP